MTQYDLSLKVFSGPLDKLLELVEAKKLDINNISLAEVTNDFLAYLKTLEKIETPFLADFISVASRLILIKSKSLLPDFVLTPEEEHDIKDLEERLNVYRAFRPALRSMGKLWAAGSWQISRPYLFIRRGGGFAGILDGETNLFYPGQNVTLANLELAAQKFSSIFEKLELGTETLKQTIVTIEEKIQEIISRITTSGRTSLQNLSGTKSRSDIVAIFLAILHLVREQRINIEQGEHFSDIMIQSRPEDSASSPLLTPDE